MTIYVDELFTYGTRGAWAHLATDNLDDLTELHDFAVSIGLKRSWFQNHVTHPHYDVSPAFRNKAIKAGAVAVTRKELVMKCSRYMRE